MNSHAGFWLLCLLAPGPALAQNEQQLPGSFPIARPASPALSDPIARQLNMALGLAGALRIEASEGRAGDERTSQLLDQLQKTLLGARDNPAARERKAGDEAWSKPQAEALALIEEARQLRRQAMRLPPAQQLRVLQQLAETLGRVYAKVSEASRLRQASVNSVRNAK